MRVLDLGSAPGGWSQVAGRLVGEKGRVLATDILPMDGLKNVDFIQGDFTDEAIVQQLLDWLGARSSTSSSPTSRRTSPASIRPTRPRRSTSSSWRSRPCARTLKPGATFVAKMFQGSGLRRIPEGAARLVRQGADPQARGVTPEVARGLPGGEGVQG
jgi:23S rRNA (uridine2552-2'-O)-methyltransferase